MVDIIYMCNMFHCKTIFISLNEVRSFHVRRSILNFLKTFWDFSVAVHMWRDLWKRPLPGIGS